MLRPSLAVALLAAIPFAAHAAIDVAPAACPVDEANVEVSILLSTNSLLGHDRDLCPHATGDDEIRNAVSSCPNCGFSGTANEFKRKVTDEVSAKVKKELKPANTPWERYANRARILEWGGSPAPVVGESWLRAAWSVRLDERPVGQPVAGAIEKLVSEIPERAPSAERADALLDPARALDAKVAAEPALAADVKAAAIYASASFWRARGELDAAEERYVKALAAVKDPAAKTALTDAVARDRASIELEKSYLKKALAHFRAALAAGEKVPMEQRAMLAYLAGESARRTGAREEAQRFYKIAMSLGTEDDASPMKMLVGQGLADTAPLPKKSGKSSGKSK